MDKTCSKCGGVLEAGITTSTGLAGGAKADSNRPRLMFVVTGEPTSPNPITAFQQGLADEPWHRKYGIVGFRCSNCGALDLYAESQV